MTASRRKVRIAAGSLALGLVTCGLYAVAQPAEKVIRISAKKFDYTPNQIKLKKGVPVILELTTEDIVMGFKIPDLNTRADILPGKVARVRIVPTKAGTLAFLCDIFCGSGHEDMAGAFIVED
jgi:cytochrome c oxidase subunit II